MGRSMAAYACSGPTTWKTTMSMAPSRDPAVRPTGRKGTAGNTASIQNVAKAIEPKTSCEMEASAMVKLLVILSVFQFNINCNKRPKNTSTLDLGMKNLCFDQDYIFDMKLEAPLQSSNPKASFLAYHYIF